MIPVDPTAPPPLDDLPPFAALRDIAKEFDVQLLLFGGAATRAAMYLSYKPGFDFDLFDLAPFTSDFDVVHSGDCEKTAVITRAIRERVPFATWCRWSVMPAETWHEVESNILGGAELPLRRIVFSTGESRPWPEAALQDLKDRQVTINRSPEYQATSFAQEGRTVEVFTLLLALNTLAELRDIAGDGSLRDENRVTSWLRSQATQSEAVQLTNNKFLAVRAWHLAATRLARAPLDSEARELVDDWYSDSRVLAAFGQQEQDSYPAFAVTKRMPNDNFVVPQLFPVTKVGESAQRAAHDALLKASAHIGLLPPEIDPAFKIVAFFEGMTVDPLPSDEIEDTGETENPFGSTPKHDEFLHLAWEAKEEESNSNGSTAVLLPLADPEAFSLPPATLAVGDFFPGGRAWLRIDMEALTKALSKEKQRRDICVIVLAPNREGG